MSITRQRVLVSYQVNLETAMVEIRHSDRVVEDGEVLSAKNHQGSYEIINGDLPLHIQEEFGISITSLANEALLSFIKANAELRGAIGALENQCNEISANRESLVACIERLTAEKVALMEVLAKKESEIQDLNSRFQGLERESVKAVGQ